jgi:predicted RNase H-like HicB family nuclease
MSVDHHAYTVKWSAEDGEYVGLCAEFPSLSWLAKTPEEAIAGIRRVVAESVEDMRANTHIGSDFDDFLREEGIYGEVTATAMQRVSEWQAKQGKKP